MLFQAIGTSQRKKRNKNSPKYSRTLVSVYEKGEQIAYRKFEKKKCEICTKISKTLLSLKIWVKISNAKQ